MAYEPYRSFPIFNVVSNITVFKNRPSFNTLNFFKFCPVVYFLGWEEESG